VGGENGKERKEVKRWRRKEREKEKRKSGKEKQKCKKEAIEITKKGK
jgi:hypothetical protein